MGKNQPGIPMVFRMEWLYTMQSNLVSQDNPTGMITNSDLKIGGILLLWHCPLSARTKCHNLLGSLSLHPVGPSTYLKKFLRCCKTHPCTLSTNESRHAFPITALHTPGDQNSISDILSRSFQSTPAWQLTLFNSIFPLLNQNSWIVFLPTSKICTRLI